MEKYIVELTSAEQKELAQLVSKGKATARKLRMLGFYFSQTNHKMAQPGQTDRFRRPLVFTPIQSTAFDGDSSSMDYRRLWNVRSKTILLADAL